MPQFPSPEWIAEIKTKLNSDARYAEIASKWEGDMLCIIEPSGSLQQPIGYYLDLWHGKCRDAFAVESFEQMKPVFVLKGSYDNYVRLLKGQLDPLQAMLTRKLGVQGSMSVMMRNVPTVLDFVRCCREITDGFL